jgi:hypothetical protein
MRKVVLHAAALLLLVFAPPILGPRLLHAGAVQAPGSQPADSRTASNQTASDQTAGHQKQPASDLDSLMATVLQHRDENWRRLHDYVLREKEAFSLEGPGRARLYGSEREFTWYQRDGYLVRSPLRYDKVTLSEADRRKYEDNWLKEEKEREEEHAKKAAAKAQVHRSAEEPQVMDVQSFIREGGEPRFVSEAYFLEFKFEPGNYYLAGREKIENRDVLRIEYYPQRLFNDDDDDRRRRDEERAREQRQQADKGDKDEKDEKGEKRKSGKNAKRDKERDRERDFEQHIERSMNKVALITLWVDPAVSQIVKFTFENVDFGFLPGRWLVRVGDVKATMVMGQPFPDVWLPREMLFEGDVTLAPGTFQARYAREYYDYRQGETRARIRHYGDVKEQ